MWTPPPNKGPAPLTKIGVPVIIPNGTHPDAFLGQPAPPENLKPVVEVPPVDEAPTEEPAND